MYQPKNSFVYRKIKKHINSFNLSNHVYNKYYIIRYVLKYPKNYLLKLNKYIRTDILITCWEIINYINNNFFVKINI